MTESGAAVPQPSESYRAWATAGVSPEQLRRSATVAANMAVNKLANSDWELLASSQQEGLSIDELRARMTAYPERLTAPPVELYDSLPVLEEPDAFPPTYHLAVRLWTEQGNPSRLVVKLRSRQAPQRHRLAFDCRIVGLDIEDI